MEGIYFYWYMIGYVPSIIIRYKQVVIGLIEEKVVIVGNKIDWLLDKQEINTVRRCQSQVQYKDKWVSIENKETLGIR